MSKYLYLLCGALLAKPAAAQELYPYTEPASNMPAHSVSAKLTSMVMRTVHSPDLRQRHMPEVMFGINKKWMAHASLNFSDMHGEGFIWEGARLYGKYRFLSLDGVHRHFRMAAFAAAAYSRNHLDHNELNLMGDHSGVQGGLIATQLIDRWAFSATGSVVQGLAKERWAKVRPQPYTFSALQYAVSAGVLVLPRTYTDYRQTNLNLYVELLGNRNLDLRSERYYLDLAPAVQLIFNSTGKLNLGYRFELGSDIYRISRRQFMVSYEHIFLGALKRR
ncbi:hypothetical protein [Flaviaesturariibacter amylovorans]